MPRGTGRPSPSRTRRVATSAVYYNPGRCAKGRGIRPTRSAQTSGAGTTDADTARCNDSSRSHQGRHVVPREDLLQESHHRADAVSVGPERQDASVGPWGVGAHICEPLVARYQVSTFVLYGVPQLWVFPSSHALIHHTDSIVPAISEHLRAGSGQVLVGLDSHGYA